MACFDLTFASEEVQDSRSDELGDVRSILWGSRFVGPLLGASEVLLRTSLGSGVGTKAESRQGVV